MGTTGGSGVHPSLYLPFGKSRRIRALAFGNPCAGSQTATIHEAAQNQEPSQTAEPRNASLE